MQLALKSNNLEEISYLKKLTLKNHLTTTIHQCIPLNIYLPDGKKRHFSFL